GRISSDACGVGASTAHRAGPATRSLKARRALAWDKLDRPFRGGERLTADYVAKSRSPNCPCRAGRICPLASTYNGTTDFNGKGTELEGNQAADFGAEVRRRAGRCPRQAFRGAPGWRRRRVGTNANQSRAAGDGIAWLRDGGPLPAGTALAQGPDSERG